MNFRLFFFFGKILEIYIVFIWSLVFLKKKSGFLLFLAIEYTRDIVF